MKLIKTLYKLLIVNPKIWMIKRQMVADFQKLGGSKEQAIKSIQELGQVKLNVPDEYKAWWAK